jgi:tetratricopeptide (TPR) repeat protein
MGIYILLLSILICLALSQEVISSVGSARDEEGGAQRSNVQYSRRQADDGKSEAFASMKHLLDQGNATQALEIFTTMSESEQNEYETQIQYARALGQRRQMDEAMDVLNNQIKTRSSLNLPTYEAHLLKARVHIMAEQWTAAKALLIKIMQTAPDDAMDAESFTFLYGSLAKVVNYEGDHENAKELLIKAWNYDTKDPKVAFDLGMVLMALGEYEEGKHWFDLVETMNKNLDHKLLGKIFYHYQQFEACYSEFKKVVDSNPNDPDANIFLAETSEILGYPEDAYSYYLRTIELEPHNVLAHVGIGLLLLGTGSSNYGAIQACGSESAEEAIQHLSLALKIDSSNEVR